MHPHLNWWKWHREESDNQEPQEKKKKKIANIQNIVKFENTHFQFSQCFHYSLVLEMDILQTILRSCESENYYNNFKDNDIDSCDLNLLVDEDLEEIGIKDVEKRKKILKLLSTSQIPIERKINLIVDNHYTQIVLTQMSEQLRRHLAMLTYALKRGDIDLCNINLYPSVHCLLGILQNLEKKLESFECQVAKKRTKQNKLLIIIPTIVMGSLAVLVYYKNNL